MAETAILAKSGQNGAKGRKDQIGQKKNKVAKKPK